MQRLRPGLTLTRMVDRWGPNRIRVLRVDPSTPLSIDVALAGSDLPGSARTSAIARRRGAVAAINGDYSMLSYPDGAGRPVNAFARDGALEASPLIWGRNFSISQDEKRFYFDHAVLKGTLVQHDSRTRWSVPAFNEHRPARDVLSVSTPAGGRAFRPLAHACSARLYRTGRLRWGEIRIGVRRTYTVDRVRCSEFPLARRGGIVVSAGRGSDAGRAIRSSLRDGERVDLGWSLGTWTGVLDTIGGNPLLVADGSLAVGACSGSYFCYRNPRTGIGVTARGRLLLVTVDGRRPRWSVGMTPVAFAKLFRRLGATWALNLDGGGSTTMWAQGRVVNRPSDPGGERAVGSAILVLPRGDRGEPRPVPVPTSGSVSVWSAPGASPAALGAIDPASTGGMLDALTRGIFGVPGTEGSRALRPVLERYVAHYGEPSAGAGGRVRLPAALDPLATR